jgi:nucleoside-diphosphate-sugar epimerase
MPRVLIAGCGYVGRATARVFKDAGWEMEGWTSSAESAEELSAEPYPVRGVNIGEAAAVNQAATSVDAVIHCASSRGGRAEDYRRIYLAGARNLAAAFPEALILFTSSTSVYAQKDGEWVTEESPAEPQHETGRILIEAEEFVLARGGVVARLAGIYGPGRSALLRKFLAGEAVVDSTNNRFLNQVHRDDIASALLLLVKRHLESTSGQEGVGARIYNVSDNHPLTHRECYEWLASHLGRPLPPSGIAPGERKRGQSNKRVSSARLQGLGWSPQYPTFQAAMIESILPALGR